MNKLDKTLKVMDLEFFASGQHGVTPAMVAGCLDNSEPCVFLDLRTETEARYLRFGNVQHIPLEQLPDRIGEIPRNRPVIVLMLKPGPLHGAGVQPGGQTPCSCSTCC